jgi:tRNA(adenine34) deaminase
MSLISNISNISDEAWMRAALNLAVIAAEAGEVPVGAVVVYNGEIVGRGFNQPISTQDPTAHAEVIAMREAARVLGNYRLVNCDLYVTLEPCLMCVGALIHARIRKVIFGAMEEKSGALSSRVLGAQLPCHNHKILVEGGILAKESQELLKAFFHERRGVSSAR